MRFPSERGWERIARASIIAGAALRAIWTLVLHSPVDYIYSDMQSYVETATHLALWLPPVEFDAFYPPGTRFVLAVPLALFGPGRGGLYAGAVLWTALSALSPYFMWRYARHLLSPAAAASTAVLCALFPLHVVYASYFTSETPGLAFLTLGLWLAARARNGGSTRDGFFGGLAGGLAAATRPAFALSVFLSAIPLLVAGRKRLDALLAIAAGALLVLGVVIVHETVIVGRFVGLSQNAGLTFYLGHCDVRVVRMGPNLDVLFETPVALQLDRGNDVAFPDHHIWDQDFFFGEGLRCIAADGLSHARVLVRDLFDMGLSTIPWPASNEEGLRDVVKASNVAYVLLLPFIVLESIGLIRRRWSAGAGRGELMLLSQLSLSLVTALGFFGDPRFRTPYDVFGLALLGSLVAERFSTTSAESPVARSDFGIAEGSVRVPGASRPEIDSADEAPPHPVGEQGRLGQRADDENGHR